MSPRLKVGKNKHSLNNLLLIKSTNIELFNACKNLVCALARVRNIHLSMFPVLHLDQKHFKLYFTEYQLMTVFTKWKTMFSKRIILFEHESRVRLVSFSE